VDLYLHSPLCLHDIYRAGFTFCRPTSFRYKDLPKFRIYTNIYDLVRYPCVESDRKLVEWAAIPLYVEKLGRQFVGWELCAVRSGVSAGEHDRRTDGRSGSACSTFSGRGWKVPGRRVWGGGDRVKLT